MTVLTTRFICWLSLVFRLKSRERQRERERERERDPAKHHILWNFMYSGCWVVPFGTFIDVSKDFGASFSGSNRLFDYECENIPKTRELYAQRYSGISLKIKAFARLLWKPRISSRYVFSFKLLNSTYEHSKVHPKAGHENPEGGVEV